MARIKIQVPTHNVSTVDDLLKFIKEHKIPGEAQIGSIIHGDRNDWMDGDLNSAELVTLEDKSILVLGGFGSFYPEPD